MLLRMRRPPPVLRVFLPVAALALFAATPARATTGLPDEATLRGWIQGVSDSPKGPVAGIRWFCSDGTVLPPRPYACANHGGGIQHGLWNERALALRAGGYAIANVIAALDPERFVGDGADLDTLEQILLERFLIGWDDGWIFRGARSYRGALQIEDEEAGAMRLVLAMLDDPRWRDTSRFTLLRETVRLLPLQTDMESASRVRQLALRIAEKDAQFTPLRAKVHNAPDAKDAGRIREYARGRGKPGLSGEYEKLAAAIDSLYSARSGADAALALAPKIGDGTLASALRGNGTALRSEASLDERLVRAARLMRLLREALPGISETRVALEALQTSLALEADVYATGNTLVTRFDRLTRGSRLELLEHTAEALYGSGLIGARQRQAIESSSARIRSSRPLALGTYREELRYLALPPEWAGRWLHFWFGDAVARLAPLEPEAQLFPQDRLRGSPLLFYGALIDSLVLDANHLAGIEHRLFGVPVGAGLRALNPGLARGVLRAPNGSGAGAETASDGIYLLPETTADLPPVAGILTEGAGSSLSHVQLLARNLGIPNVVVGKSLLPKVRARLGSRAVLAVSPNGIVQLDADGPRWDAVFGTEQSAGDGVVIRADLDKLDVETVNLLPLDALRASDSGRTSGPKGANLGELKHFFGDVIPDGFVIPFGAFRRLVDQPIEPGGPAVFDWMKQQYAAIAQASGDPGRQKRITAAFLSRLRSWILNADPGPGFRAELRSMLASSFGPDGSYGVFLRSDTNVEDLPGFTGAGLNLTVANVVGFDAIMAAIHEVWASPFTERSFEWRQSHMERPEYVFPAVVVQRGFQAEKSGVLVTVDVESGEPGWISVAVNEGVGGAVEGQATESLRIDTATGTVRFMSRATARRKTVLAERGGIAHVSASGSETVLEDDEIRQLIALAGDVEQRFIALQDADGRPLPADIEFAFRNGKLALLQIRPFVQSRRAQTSQYLGQLDAGFPEPGGAVVDLGGIPRAKPAGRIAEKPDRPPGESP